ncbi:hypothetical protein [Kutzneria buriramensis]|uniref:Uncharacterized protein n=1 Tax=Kutzneria buriramensis TaxID=1045776 RepID=A0A3E0H4M3_9PSEU|nr:hypothetical protein [Kutzneria buriramensis]REH37097.1 hypothetical protein BCF44_115101 [Kutzneria buriramensis]
MYGESTSTHTPPPKPNIQNWDPNSVPPVTGGGPTNPEGTPSLTPPNVPGKGNGSNGSTAVSTPSMKIFADNIGTLIEPLNKALALVQAMPKVAAGDFHTGHVMKTMLTGDAGDGMMQSGFETVLKKCVKSVTDTHEAVLKLARDYDNIDELNKMTGQQLSRVLGDHNVSGDITAVGSVGSKFGDGSGSGSGS